ncbi:MAG: glycosyltransferase family 2 protein [Clostridium sp.]
MKVSIIIVTYNSEKDIEKCLDSIIRETKNIKYEIRVVDNDSKDNTKSIVRKFEQRHNNIKLINAENNGFNAGNNIGIKNSAGEFIALLNPDTILLNNAFKIIIDNMEKESDVGACGATLYNEDMSLNMTHGSFPTVKETLLRITKLRNDETYYLADLNQKKMLVQFPSGADFVFKRELIEKIGYMDEDYFIYFDETDYALKMNKLGLKSYIYTEAKIIHLQGSSTEGVSDFAKEKFIDSYTKYLNKNVKPFNAKMIMNIKLIENKLRLVKNKITSNSIKKKDNYDEIEKYTRILAEIDKG